MQSSLITSSLKLRLEAYRHIVRWYVHGGMKLAPATTRMTQRATGSSLYIQSAGLRVRYPCSQHQLALDQEAAITWLPWSTLAIKSDHAMVSGL